MRRLLSLLPTVVVVASLLSLGGMPATAIQDAPARVLRVNWGDLPETLDPQHSDQGQWSISGGLDWEGLTRIDEELQVAPGAAESWQFSNDGKTLTFHLRDGLVYADGVPVVAGDFVYAAERVCSPELNSRSRGELAELIGCEALFNAGIDTVAAAAARATFGVRALDDHTVEYRFTKPAPYFPSLAATWRTIPLRQDLIEAGGPDWWKNPATRIGNGPFKLVQYDTDAPEQRLTYARNERYWRGHTRLDGLEFLFIGYGEASIEAYRHGDVDAIWPGEENMPEVEADPVLSRDLVTIPDAGTGYFNFNLNREPFQDPKVREAFAYGFDREAFCQQILYGGNCLLTLSMVPPGMPGSIQTDAFAFDPQKARQALAESSYGGPENVPEITWYGGADSPGQVIDAKWQYEQYRQVLGIELNLVYLADEEMDALYDDPMTSPQYHESAWFASTDPRGWYNIWRCDSPFNSEGYCDPRFDALLDRADAELDPDKRIALYEEAGHRLVAGAPAIFVDTLASKMLVKPYVTGYTLNTGINGDWPGWMNLMTVDVERPG